MRERFIGEIIRKRRGELNLTQAKLCEGICEPITISRLEQNKQTPSRNTVKAILQRLGLPDDRYFAAVTGKELRLNNLYSKIVAYDLRYEKATDNEKKMLRKKILTAHSELEQIIDKEDTISLQLLAKSKVTIGKDEGEYAVSEKLTILENALKLTQPNFRFEDIQSGLFDYDEVTLIHHIAVVYSESGDHEKAINIWGQLLNNIEKRFSNIVPVRTQKSLVLAGYSRELGIAGRYDEAIEYAQQGMEICIYYGIYQNLPVLIMIIAECKYWQSKMDESKELFIESYYLCKVVKDENNRRIAQESLKEYFQMDID